LPDQLKQAIKFMAPSTAARLLIPTANAAIADETIDDSPLSDPTASEYNQDADEDGIHFVDSINFDYPVTPIVNLDMEP
jgi:hypothetical protein